MAAGGQYRLKPRLIETPGVCTTGELDPTLAFQQLVRYC
jgi:hypothetical protein